MSGPEIVDLTTGLALVLLVLAMVLTVIRLIRGPSLPDRILCLDLLTTLGLGFIAVIAVRTGFTVYLDIAIAVGLMGFLSTVAFARYVLKRAAAQTPAGEGGQ